MVCFLNIGRLLTHIDELRIFVSENKPYIIGINETKLDHTVIDGEVEIDEYQITRKDRNSFGGGVALYAHDTEIIFMGDLNCDLFKTNDNDTKHIKRIYNMFKLRQMINQPTRVTGDTKNAYRPYGH